MIRLTLPVLALLLVFTAMPALPVSAHSAKPQIIVNLNDNSGLTSTPVPAYPEEAARKGWDGVGLYQLHFGNDGAVNGVTVLISSEHELLDRAAQTSLARWRSQPGALRTANITISFRAGKSPGAVVVDPAKVGGDLTAAFVPPYPNAARRQRFTGKGVFMLHFRPDGSVDKVFPARSTGYEAIDAECALTFGKWRSRPGAYKVILVPITLTAPGQRRR